jgi:signal transduction histidine kinase
VKLKRQIFFFSTIALLVLIFFVPIKLSCNRLPSGSSSSKDIQNAELKYIRDYTPVECSLDSSKSFKNNGLTYYVLDFPGIYTYFELAFLFFQEEDVQEKDANGNPERTEVSHFKVLTPWYKTWWAFLLYVIGFVLLVFIVVKWRAIKLAHKKQKIEKIVEERTKEIKKKYQQLEKENIRLKEQSEKLKEMDMIKSRFFDNLSHEFRTPMTLIMGPLEQMIDSSHDPQQKKQLELMHRSSQRMLNLINQLLALSRLDGGKMKLHAVNQNIVPFLKGILPSFSMMAHQNQLEMEFRSEEKEIFLYFDAQMMEEVMYNLLINAVNYTSPGEKITIFVSTDQQDHKKEKSSPSEFVKISVSDTGIGIPTEKLPHIFDRFYLVKDIHKGSGIGLALVKEIVILHHGKIDIHSREGKNSGTEFVIYLPLGNKHLREEEIV